MVFLTRPAMHFESAHRFDLKPVPTGYSRSILESLKNRIVHI